MGVSINGGTPQSSSILIGSSLVNHPAIGVPAWPWKPGYPHIYPIHWSHWLAFSVSARSTVAVAPSPRSSQRLLSSVWGVSGLHRIHVYLCWFCIILSPIPVICPCSLDVKHNEIRLRWYFDVKCQAMPSSSNCLLQMVPGNVSFISWMLVALRTIFSGRNTGCCKNIAQAHHPYLHGVYNWISWLLWDWMDREVPAKNDILLASFGPEQAQILCHINSGTVGVLTLEYDKTQDRNPFGNPLV